ncbi:MAG: glutaredoxin family protein [Candidatus Roizmanbacteria bacterium]|nr:glutaredoxin family protein [Candidatus Roizmanbacteria bacterium]
MDQTDDQQVTNQNQGTPTVPAVQPLASDPVVPSPVQPVAPLMQDVGSLDKIDLSSQQDINPDDLRNKLNETLQPPVAPTTDPMSQVSSKEPVAQAPVEPTTVQTPAQESSSQTSDVVSEQHTEEKQPEPTGASVIVYTIDNCPFCKAEKDYLTAHSIAFEEKRVDSSEENLKEMLALSDNFAGVPVTHLKGVSSQRVVKGFTETEFTQELIDVGFLKPEEAPEASEVQPISTTEAPVEQSAVQATQDPISQQPVTAPTSTPEAPEQQSQPVMNQETPVVADQTPSIPDFPQK